MIDRRLVISLLMLNVVLLVALIAGNVPSLAAGPATVSVLRGHSLEIVDNDGRVHASIKVHGEETVNGQRYPAAVVLVMGDPRGAPGVKLSASADGAGLGLSSGQRLA